MTTKSPIPVSGRIGHREPVPSVQNDPPIRLAHVLFVLWVAGCVAWAFFAAQLAHRHGWWVLHPVLAGALVLTPPILAHLLANFIIGITGNPRFRS